jgi:dihydroorotase
MLTQLTLRRPDDWHIHLRDGEALPQTVHDICRYMGRALIMPNLVPPVTTAAQALAYKERILAHSPDNSTFTPLMSIYLTDNTTPEIIKEAKKNGVVAAKLYPAGATTNSDSGVTNISALHDTLDAMAECGLLLLLHGEMTDHDIDIFDREPIFLEHVLTPLMAQHPTLKIVLEHITTQEAVQFVRQHSDRLGATITAHHLMYNRNHMLVGGIRPHYYCLPILKRRTHQEALIEAATSGERNFFLGTDSAPHAKHKKENSCGCAGAYTAHASIELYAEVFEQANALDKLEDFSSRFGPEFYGLPLNNDTITLVKKAQLIPDSLPFGNDTVVPVKAGENIAWQILNQK